MFTYITMCRDITKDGTQITLPYISDDNLVLFDTKEKAYNSAMAMAEDEVVELNDDEGLTTPAVIEESSVSFGIPDDENDNEVVVNYYYYDTTEWVTKRIIKEIA